MCLVLTVKPMMMKIAAGCKKGEKWKMILHFLPSHFLTYLFLTFIPMIFHFFYVISLNVFKYNKDGTVSSCYSLSYIIQSGNTFKPLTKGKACFSIHKPHKRIAIWQLNISVEISHKSFICKCLNQQWRSEKLQRNLLFQLFHIY
jgi:hypothetical protein